MFLPLPYCDFFSGSCVAPEDDAPLGEELLGELAPPVLDGLELAPPVLDELELAPPEAEPVPGLEESVALGELAPGVAVEPVGAGALDVPPEGEVVLEGGVVLDGGVELAPLLVLPLVVPLGLLLSWPQAARPKAMATAIASVESFMCPPWLG